RTRAAGTSVGRSVWPDLRSRARSHCAIRNFDDLACQARRRCRSSMAAWCCSGRRAGRNIQGDHACQETSRARIKPYAPSPAIAGEGASNGAGVPGESLLREHLDKADASGNVAAEEDAVRIGRIDVDPPWIRFGFGERELDPLVGLGIEPR